MLFHRLILFIEMHLYVADYSLFAPNFRHYKPVQISCFMRGLRGWQRYTLLHFTPNSLTEVRAHAVAQTILPLHALDHVCTVAGET